MISFLLSVLVLILGSFFSGSFPERVFGADKAAAILANRLADRVDFTLTQTTGKLP